MKKALTGLILLAACLLVVFVSLLRPQQTEPRSDIHLPEQSGLANSSSNNDNSLSTPSELPTRNIQDFTILSEAELVNLSDDQLFQYLIDVHTYTANTNDSIFAFNSVKFHANPDDAPYENNLAMREMVKTTRINAAVVFTFYFEFIEGVSLNNAYADFLIQGANSSGSWLGKDDYTDDILKWVNASKPYSGLFWDILNAQGKLEALNVRVKQDLIKAFINGDSLAYARLSAAGWADDLQEHELLSAFLRLDPKSDNISFELLLKVFSFDLPESYAAFQSLVEFNPNRYRLFKILKRNPNIDLSPAVSRLMSSVDLLPRKDQISSALIALNFGYDQALTILLNQESNFIKLDSDINIKKQVIRMVSFPEDVKPNSAWVLDNLTDLQFNQVTQKFEL